MANQNDFTGEFKILRKAASSNTWCEVPVNMGGRNIVTRERAFDVMEKATGKRQYDGVSKHSDTRYRMKPVLRIVATKRHPVGYV